MRIASHLLFGWVVAAAAGCAADQMDRTFDPSLLSPRLYCPDDGRVSLSHLRLKGLGTTDVATIRPRMKPEAPGRVVRKWTTAVIAGQFDVVLEPGPDGRDKGVELDVRVVCGPGRGLHAEARGDRVRVRFADGALDVTAIGNPAPPGPE